MISIPHKAKQFLVFTIKLLIVIGAFYFILWFFGRRKAYNLTEMKYFNTNNEYIGKRIKEVNPKESVEFSEDYFYFSNGEMDLKLKWDVFTSFKKIEEDVLLIQTNKFLIFNFLLSVEEIGLENFDKISRFLELKIQNNGTL